MKIQKGEAGYLKAHKTKIAVETVLSFVLVIGLVVAGYLLNHTKLNWLTLVAVLASLPACRLLVNLIMLVPYHSINEAKEMEISGRTEYLTMLYDLVITSEKKAMPIEVVAISNHTVCGYTSSKKVDTIYAANHIKSILVQNRIEKMTVKIFHDYVAFLSRAEGMNSIASIEQNGNDGREEIIRDLILDISL